MGIRQICPVTRPLLTKMQFTERHPPISRRHTLFALSVPHFIFSGSPIILSEPYHSFLKSHFFLPESSFLISEPDH